MDKETKAYLDALEGRLMARMNNNQEQIIERMRGLETNVTLLTELSKSANTLMAGIVGILTDLGKRVTDLERKD